jgi:hypothetical protein
VYNIIWTAQDVKLRMLLKTNLHEYRNSTAAGFFKKTGNTRMIMRIRIASPYSGLNIFRKVLLKKKKYKQLLSKPIPGNIRAHKENP